MTARCSIEFAVNCSTLALCPGARLVTHHPGSRSREWLWIPASVERRQAGRARHFATTNDSGSYPHLVVDIRISTVPVKFPSAHAGPEETGGSDANRAVLPFMLGIGKPRHRNGVDNVLPVASQARRP
jgi:hypothetical protein